MCASMRYNKSIIIQEVKEMYEFYKENPNTFAFASLRTFSEKTVTACGHFVDTAIAAVSIILSIIILIVPIAG